MALNENLIIYIQRASHFHNDFRRPIFQPNGEAEAQIVEVAWPRFQR